MLTKDKIIGIFCFIDDLLKSCGHYEDSRRQVSDSEIITTAVISSLHFGGHQDKVRQFMKMTGFIPIMLDKSGFNRRLHALAELIYVLFMDSESAAFIKEYMRKRVETTISEIKGLFLRKFMQ